MSRSRFDRSLLPPAEAFFRANVAKLRSRGPRALGLCPFHPDEHPSLSIDLERGLWFCHSCGEGGDIVRFIMLQQGLTFRPAAQYLGALREAGEDELRQWNRQQREAERRAAQASAQAETARRERLLAGEHLLAVKTLYEESIAEHDWLGMSGLLPRVRQAEDNYAAFAGIRLEYRA